ncbi:hypothetical protein ACJJTC_006581 [Scirpophaga incertulas]
MDDWGIDTAECAGSPKPHSWLRVPYQTASNCVSVSVSKCSVLPRTWSGLTDGSKRHYDYDDEMADIYNNFSICINTNKLSALPYYWLESGEYSVTEIPLGDGRPIEIPGFVC